MVGCDVFSGLVSDGLVVMNDNDNGQLNGWSTAFNGCLMAVLNGLLMVSSWGIGAKFV